MPNRGLLNLELPSYSLERQFLGEAVALLPFLQDPLVTDILINGRESLYVERLGKLNAFASPFSELRSLSDFIERLLIPLGKRVDAIRPYLDGRLADGSRFHLILPPVAPRGPCISIRKFNRLGAKGLEAFGAGASIALLRQWVKERKNILIAGGTGSGKTTLLSVLLNEVSHEERIALIEESLEISTDHPHAFRLEARVAGPEGAGEVSLRDLVRNCLRMRPDRVVIGECRGAETFDMLQAMSTGHPGSIATVHANSALGALKRVEQMVLLAGFSLSIPVIRDWVSSCIEGVVFLKRVAEMRIITEILQVQGLEGEVYRVLPRFESRNGTF